MKVFISSDMEGTAGVVDWGQCLPGEPEYERGRELLLAEVNAAIDGAITGGATDILVNDSHSTMANLPPQRLHGRASYLSGRHKPMYMMQGLDDSYDAVFFVSYHGSMGGPTSALSHTYNPRAIAQVRLNGTVAGEAGINALVALAHGVPVALVTGDDVTAAEAAPFCPGVEAAVVKRSVSRFAAESLHPDVACARIEAAATQALQRLPGLEPPAISLPATLLVGWRNADLAEMATWLRGVERTDTTTVAMTDDDPVRLYRTFVTAVLLTRGIAVTWRDPATRRPGARAATPRPGARTRRLPRSRWCPGHLTNDYSELGGWGQAEARSADRTCDAASVTPAQRLREVLNWLNGSTPTGLVIARSGGAVLARHADGIWTATQYRGIASRRPFTVGNVIITRHSAEELRRRPGLRAHEARHATQWAVLGPAFVPLYFGAAIASRVLTGDDAAANPFELLAGLRDGGYLLPA